MMTSNQETHRRGATSAAPAANRWHHPLHPALSVAVDYGARAARCCRTTSISDDSRHPARDSPPVAICMPCSVSQAGLLEMLIPKGPARAEQSARLVYGSSARLRGDLRPEERPRMQYQMYDRALSLMKSARPGRVRPDAGAGSGAQAYGSDSFGQGCLLARRLVTATGRAICRSEHQWVGYPHRQFRPHAGAVRRAGSGLSTLLTELSSLGMLNDTMVVPRHQFGRTPIINTNQGRDHFPRRSPARCSAVGSSGYVHGR
jgi:hypothetical protein